MRVVRVETRQCGLGRRIAMDERQRAMTEMRPYGRSHEQLEKLIALHIRCTAFAATCTGRSS